MSDMPDDTTFIPLTFKETDCCEEHRNDPLYLGSHVDPHTFMDIGQGQLFGIPPTDLRAVWLQPVNGVDPDTGQQQLCTALAGSVESGHTFVFAVGLVPCFTTIPLN